MGFSNQYFFVTITLFYFVLYTSFSMLLFAVLNLWISVLVAVPTFLWPLDNKSYSAEVVLSPFVRVDTSQCGRTFGNPPIGSVNSVIECDGNSYVDVDLLNGYTPTKDYSFSGRFMPTVNSAALFHYKANDATQQFKEMMLYINGGKFFMTRTISGPTVEVSTQITTTLTLNTWHSVTFGIDRSNGKGKVYLNKNKEIDEEFDHNRDFVTPGVLRIGGTFDQSQPNFKGRIACAAFWDDEKEPNTDTSHNWCNTKIYNSKY
jgi:hypothetical protein